MTGAVLALIIRVPGWFGFKPSEFVAGAVVTSLLVIGLAAYSGYLVHAGYDWAEGKCQSAELSRENAELAARLVEKDRQLERTMMADQPEKTAGEKLVNNVILTLVARGAIVLATGLVLPLALMMGQRAVSNIDEIARKIDAMREQAFETTGAIQMLKTVSAQQGQILSDHEARVRMLEASTRRAEPISRP